MLSFTNRRLFSSAAEKHFSVESIGNDVFLFNKVPPYFEMTVELYGRRIDVHHDDTINKENNVAMPVEGMRKTVSMRKPEVMGKVACDVHPWMAGWFGVMEHPCFAVTDGQGRFSIAGVPPGEHTLKIWHETLGTREVQVTVTAGGTATVDDVSL